MREIKFRGKNSFQNNWFYGFLTKEKNKYYITEDSTDFYQIDENTIGQFTGLYDKNNVPIYEGDVINNKGIVEDANYEVIYDGGAFYGKRKNYYYPEEEVFLKLYKADKENVEVIGNIYDKETN